MMEYKLSESDCSEIYQRAVREYNETAVSAKLSYEKFFTKCFITSFTGFLIKKNLTVKQGVIYVAEEG